MMPADDIINPAERDDDAQYDERIRPQRFDDFPGQEPLKEKLRIAIAAAKGRGEALDHILLSGPPGLGKTTLARIIANEMSVDFKATSGPVIERQADLSAILTSLETNDVLFIDEIHRLNHAVEETLYSAMEDYEIDILLGKGPTARSMKIGLKPFTLVGATTRSGLLTPPLRARFGDTCRLEFYSPEELETIIQRSARILTAPVEPEGALEIAARSRGTARVANRLLRRVRDYAQVKGNGTITHDMAKAALDMLGIPFKPVHGYKGLKEVETAILQNEGQVANSSLPGWLASIVPTMGKQGLVIPLWQIAAPGAGGSYPRAKAIPDIPTFEEFHASVKGGAKPSGMPHQAMRAFMDPQTSMFRAIFFPPKTPKETVAILRDAYVSMWKDPKFLETYTKVVKSEPGLVVGDAADKVMASLKTVSPEVKKFLTSHGERIQGK